MSEPRSNIAFASKLLAEGLPESAVVARLVEERELSTADARKILKKLARAEARPSPLLSQLMVSLGALMILFGVWVIVNAYNDPEMLDNKAGFVKGPPKIRQMWRVTLMCWTCGGIVASAGVYKLKRALKKPGDEPPPPVVAMETPDPDKPRMSVPDMQRFALKERVKGKTVEQVTALLMAKGVPHPLASQIAKAAR